MRALVLGGSVFVGRHTVQALVDAGHDVTVLNRGRTADQTAAFGDGKSQQNCSPRNFPRERLYVALKGHHTWLN